MVWYVHVKTLTSPIEHLIAHICLDHAWLPVSWLEKYIHGGWMQTINEDPPDS